MGNIVPTLFFLVLLTRKAISYKGVIRQSNGTDIELRRWYKDQQRCGDTFVVTQNKPIEIDDDTCGYKCLWKDGEPHSSNTVQPGGGLTCESDQNIRQGKCEYLKISMKFRKKCSVINFELKF